MDPRVGLLTERELQLLHHVFEGRTDKEIAQVEGIASQTAANGIYRARSKLGGLDRRRAARLVAEAKGWSRSIKPTPGKNTLSSAVLSQPYEPVSHEGRLANPDQAALQLEGMVFVQTPAPERPGPAPERRNQHDMLTRVSMLLIRTAFLVAATVALLWVYGRT